jgi:uncharacterized membrane protein
MKAAEKLFLTLHVRSSPLAPPRFDTPSRIVSLLRSHFLAGLLVVVPIGAIFWIALLALKTLWGLQGWLPMAWRPEAWLPSRGLAFLVSFGFMVGTALLLAMGVSFVGWSSKQLLGQKMLEFIGEHVIQRIPVLRGIHKALDQLLRTMASGGGQQFRRVVYVEYPRKGLWIIAFVTGTARVKGFGPGNWLNIYVPTTPNPTSGFHLIVSESEVRDSHLSVEEAMRTILSLGIVTGTELPGEEKHAPAAPALTGQAGNERAGTQASSQDARPAGASASALAANTPHD